MANSTSKAYTCDDERDRTYNDPRMDHPERVQPSKSDMASGREFPVFMTPEKKMTLMMWRPCCVTITKVLSHDPVHQRSETGKSHGVRLASSAPSMKQYDAGPSVVVAKEIAKRPTLVWHGRPHRVCSWVLQRLKAYPANYTMGTDKAGRSAHLLKYRKLQTLTMTDYPKPAPIVKKPTKHGR